LKQYDSIVIGAGHNGLVCAAYLAGRGHRVLVLEAAGAPGGLAANREFHPGFHVSVAHSVRHFSQKIAGDLNLASHGYTAATDAAQTVGLSRDGNHAVVAQTDLSGAGADDNAAYQDYMRQMRRFAAALKPFWLKTMPRIGATGFGDLTTFAQLGLKLRGLGKKDMQEFMRIATLPMRDLMDEYFENELVKATLSWDGMIGGKMAPRSPNSAVLALLYRMAEGGGHCVPASSVRGLIGALAASATAAGAEIRCLAPVDRVLIDSSADGLNAAGVQLADGEKIAANRVISAADPRRTFVNLVGVEYLDIGFTNRIQRLRCNGYVAKLHLALNGKPDFKGLSNADGRMIIAPALDTIEFSFDNAKYGELPDEPVMEIVVPSIHDASLAPDGQHVLSAHVMYVPYDLKGGWTDAARDDMRKRAIDAIEQYAPGLRDQIVHSELLTPADLENEYHVTGGHWHHTEFAADQLLMMRPTYGAAQYSTPIPGLFLCSAGSHPGGDLVGAAGHNAAREVLR
jgi:phytoene dehydrogenase-like protein